MFFLVTLLKRFLNILNSNAAPWQIALGAFLGILLGFLPVFTFAEGLAWLGCLVVLLVVFVNCHLGSALLFWGLGSLLALSLKGPALALGTALAPLAEFSARVPLLAGSRLNHTGWLGLTLVGLALAPVAAWAMRSATIAFRTRFRDRLLARKKLVLAGKVASNGILLRLTCWFFGL